MHRRSPFGRGQAAAPQPSFSSLKASRLFQSSSATENVWEGRGWEPPDEEAVLDVRKSLLELFRFSSSGEYRMGGGGGVLRMYCEKALRFVCLSEPWFVPHFICCIITLAKSGCEERMERKL